MSRVWYMFQWNHEQDTGHRIHTPAQDTVLFNGMIKEWQAHLRYLISIL